MEAISDILQRRGDLQKNFKSLSVDILKNPDIAAFVAAHQLTEDQIARSYAKFQEYLTEKARDDASYRPTLIMNEGAADVAYRVTEALVARQEARAQSRRVALVGLPRQLRQVSWEQVQTDNSSQQAIYQAIVRFVQHFPAERGLYIYGQFGIGKSFLMAAMAHSLAKKGLSTTLLHYPTFIAETDYGNVHDRVDRAKRAQVLVLDDIGAETNSAWVRDSILQVILQHRMDNQLPTFFTSNFNMKELEQHFAETRETKDIWPAKRVMERISYLAQEILMQGDNRRHGKQ